ncbi:hypothetical protein RRX38_14175 [Pseudomonas sp. DTU_2021_1001937_2_SI_NGA_ILE_001]|uniref:hypothetical protein n=1 Tax=Pseudomonas sp. DTU_2021_1001937_2_SI_NGA_ILE_001 TaxID=3077589 RepID=UPI0028FC12C0|nr:hypothetical protein [Pseudomonas sp. DTU_2021_1001937_2_SI_NGA_ILE_001]WNW12244.1 hypothetical protein RRX38_14175 [Pseudomonas sp. DTU_2021_1001937_2_SI_NGA_ILE_001]
MKIVTALLLSCMMLAGCSGSKACQVFSPASMNLPTTENSQRVEAQATGEPADDGKHEQHCP